MNKAQKLLQMVESFKSKYIKESKIPDYMQEIGRAYIAECPCPRCGGTEKKNYHDYDTEQDYMECLKCGDRHYLDNYGYPIGGYMVDDI